MSEWKFNDPPNVAVIANRKIAEKADWIAYVSHDAEDGAWQFHNSEPGPAKESEGVVVSLRDILQIDPTTAELADLPPGWHAWRESKSSAWQRARIARSKDQ